MSTKRNIPQLALKMQLRPIRNAAAAKAELLHLAAEIAEFPPTPAKLQEWAAQLDRISMPLPKLQPAFEMLREAISTAMKCETEYRKIWNEYMKILNTSSKSYLNPHASVHCDPKIVARINQESCPFESGKPCPFGDFYCVNRCGTPCDHLAAGLELASKHWRDFAAADSRSQLRRAASRCNRLVQKNLDLWVHSITHALFMTARTPLYQAEALVVDALIQPA